MARWYQERFARTTPRAVDGGIKASTQRGAFGQSWWGKRWTQVLDSFDLGARLTRGRSYARQGQVVTIDIDKGVITAKVQGSRVTPYKVIIQMAVIPGATWEKITATLANEARFLARLLAGEMPEEIEEAFKKVGIGLFPSHAKDMSTDCSCPDWSNPCKHIAAVYLLLGEVFDKDPFLIFTLRGMERAELLAALGSLGRPTTTAAQPVPAGEPLSPDLESFWRGQELPQDLFGEVALPPMNAAILKRLGAIPLWRSERPLAETLGGIYPLAAKRGLDIFLGGEGVVLDMDSTAKK